MINHLPSTDERLAILAPIAAYWVTSGIYAVMGRLSMYRLHSKDERNLVPKGVVLRTVLLQQLLQAAVAFAVLKVKREEPATAAITHATPAVVVAWQFVVAMIVLDTWQYFGHRLMHQNKFLYRHVHSWHHRLVAPYAFGDQYNHPAEGLLLDTLSGALALAVSGMSPRTSAFFFTFTTIKVVDDHSGMLLPGNPLHLIFRNSTAYRDVHHQLRGSRCNFAQPFFCWWDFLLGTYMPFSIVKAAHGGFEAVPATAKKERGNYVY